MAAVIKDLRTFNVGVNAAFKTALQGNSGDQSADFTMAVNVTSKTIEFPIAGSVGPLREWKGSRIVKGIARSAYQLSTKKYEKTISLDREDEEDDNLDVYMPSIRYLAQQTANWRSQQVHKALEANGAGYDDVPFFSSTHPNASTGLNESNYQAGANPAFYVFDTSSPLKAIIWAERIAPRIVARINENDDNVFWRDQYIWGVRARGGAGYGLWQAAYKSKSTLDAANFEAIETSMRMRADDEGENLGLAPTLVVVPPALKWDAMRLFGRNTNVDGTDNLHKDGVRWIVSNRLTGA
jgi:phage major head subunit gpT-like protein